MARHPIGAVFGLEVISAVAMSEDVKKELTISLQPGADTTKQFLPIFHVLKHFHRNDAIKRIGRNRKLIHITRDDGDVIESTNFTLTQNILSLGSRI